MNKSKKAGLLLAMDLTTKNRRKKNDNMVLYGKKRCAACEYWSGAREADACAQRARCKASEDGICNNPKSTFCKRRTQASYSGCMKWEKWNKLTKML